MNKIITLYLARVILLAIAITMFLIVGIDFVFGMVNELRHIGTGDYGMSDALIFLILSLPQKIYQMFPMGVLVGTMLGLGQLAASSELIVMQAAGMSPLSISKDLLKLGLVMSLCIWIIGETLAPQSDKLAHNLKAQALGGGQTLLTANGTWMRHNREFVHIQKMYVGGHLEGITRYEFDEDMALTKSSFAKFADYIGGKWILYNINSTHFYSDRTATTHEFEGAWDTGIDPSILEIAGAKYLDELSIFGLWKTIKYRQDNGLDVKPYQLALLQKFMQPISILVMIFLAVPFAFGPLRSATMGLKLIIGILLGFSFHTVNDLFGPLTLVYQMPPLLGAIAPTLFFMLLAIIISSRYLLKRKPSPAQSIM